MKKIDFNEFDTFEKIGGGILGSVAIISAIFEMFFNGVSAATIAGAVKDISGTLIVVMVLLVALKKLFPKKHKGFTNAFLDEMEHISRKFYPAITLLKSEKIEFNIADNLSCLYGKDPGSYHRFFAFSEKDQSITFKTSKTVFFGRTSDHHEQELEIIALDIAKTIDKSFALVNRFTGNKDSFTIYFEKPLETAEDAKILASIIEKILILYIAHSKKQK